MFSAAVAALLTVTVLDLKGDPQDTSTCCFTNTTQVLTDQITYCAPCPSKTQPSSPPKSAIWVNALLFLSLVISITCALLATLLHQWARRYVSFTQQSGYSLHKRARIRAFFADGVDKFRVSWVAEALPALLHLSLCFFLAGLLVWLYNINAYLFFAVVWWVGLSALAYVWITFLPIFRPNSPYYAPLSSTLWFLYTGIPYAVFKALTCSAFRTRRHFDNLDYYYERLSDGIGKTAQKTASSREMASETDVRILVSTLEALGEDGARAKFYEAIPGFFDSNQVQVKDLEEPCLNDFQTKFTRELHGFLDSTFSSNLVSESTRSFQLISCLNAVHTVLGFDGVSKVLYNIINEPLPKLLQSVEVAHSLRRWSGPDGQFAPLVRRIITQIIAGVRERDDRWISLTRAEFGVPDHMLRDNVGHGDSALLSLLIHVTRQAFSSGSWTQFTLFSLTQFDTRNTRPELQHEFCDLWNEIVREALRGGPDSTAINILREIRQAFFGLHQGADVVRTAFSSHTPHYHPVLADPLSYRVCNISSHRLEWTQAPREPVPTHLTVTVTPTRAAFGSSAASTTQIGDSPSPSPRAVPMEIHRNPGKAEIVIISPDSNILQTTSQQANETNVVLRFPSSTSLAISQPDYTPHRTHALWSTAPSPVYTTPRVHLLPLRRLSDQASQFALSVDDADANHVRPEDTMTDPSGSETEENSTDPIPPPSFSVPDPNHVPDASQCLTLALTSPHPPESNKRQETAVPCAASNTSEISSTAKPISLSIPSSGATERGAEMTAIPSAVVSGSGHRSSTVQTPVVRSGAIPAELPSSEKLPCVQLQPISHPLGSSFSSSTTRSDVSLANGNPLARGDTSYSDESSR